MDTSHCFPCTLTYCLATHSCKRKLPPEASYLFLSPPWFRFSSVLYKCMCLSFTEYGTNNTTKLDVNAAYGCPDKVADKEWMDHVQNTRLREMWRNCNRCTTTVAPHMTTHPSNITSCGWQKRMLVPRMLGNLLVDDKHQAMYCVIPKVACTNWKRAMARLSGRLNNTDSEALRLMNVHGEALLNQLGLRHLNTYPLEEIRMRMDKYYKFMFVRHPLERLLSAYRDKFTIQNKWTEHFQHKYGRRIIRSLRKDPSKESLAEGNDVTFSEFVKYVSKKAMSSRASNPHWTSYYDLCHPCSIKYDFIGKFDTFTVDSTYILSKLSKSDCPQPFPTIMPSGATTRQVMSEYYKTLSRSDISVLVQAFLPDFVMFGYDLNFPQNHS